MVAAAERFGPEARIPRERTAERWRCYKTSRFARPPLTSAASVVQQSVDAFVSLGRGGVSLGLGTQLAGGFSSQVSASWTYYWQLIPSDMPLPFA
jgi:hypothetical protein